MLFATAVAVILAVVAGAGAVARGVGPFARAAARSAVYVAISRSTDESDTREIEAIDLAAGTRELFDAGGRVVFLDATTGTRFDEVDVHGPAITSLVPTPDGRTLYAITGTNVLGSVVPIQTAFGFETQRALGTVFAAASTAGVIHVCVQLERALAVTSSRRIGSRPSRGPSVGPRQAGPAVPTSFSRAVIRRNFSCSTPQRGGRRAHSLSWGSLPG